MRPVWIALALLAACTRPGQERAVAELDVGRASDGAGVTVVVRDGLAAVRVIEPGAIELWAQAPVLTIDVDVAAGATTDWRITIENVLPDAELSRSYTSCSGPTAVILCRGGTAERSSAGDVERARGRGAW